MGSPQGSPCVRPACLTSKTCRRTRPLQPFWRGIVPIIMKIPGKPMVFGCLPGGKYSQKAWFSWYFDRFLVLPVAPYGCLFRKGHHIGRRRRAGPVSDEPLRDNASVGQTASLKKALSATSNVATRLVLPAWVVVGWLVWWFGRCWCPGRTYTP